MDGDDEDLGRLLLSRLEGRWRGAGDGHYPTIEPFAYLEEVDVRATGRPFRTYVQRTRHPDSGAPMHAEVGYLRAPGGDRLELVVAHPTGIVELEEGTVRRVGAAGLEVALVATTVGTSASAKAVRTLRRTLRLDGERLAYDLWMGHGDVVDGHHLAATLERVADPDGGTDGPA